MIVSAKIKLADARAELRLSQAALAELSRISKRAIVNAERGTPIQRISAHAILQGLNQARGERGMPRLDITDIDWEIRGE